MATVIVYFTREGSTEYAAKELAQRLDAALIQLVERRSRKGFFGFMSGGFQSSTRRQSHLVDEPWQRIEGYDTVYLMTPIWAENTTPAINTFLAHADLHGKTVHGVTFQADPKLTGSDKAFAYLRECISGAGGTPGRFTALHGAAPGKFAGEDKIRREIGTVE